MTQPKTASKFTPGPLPGPYSVEVRGAFKVHLILDVNGRVVAELDNGYKPEIIARTATLLRAAPEMYELLSTLAEDNFLCDNGNSVCDEARQIKAAIDGEG